MKRLKTFLQAQRHNPTKLIFFFLIFYLAAIFIYIFHKEDKFESQWQPVYSTYYKDETGLSIFFDLIKKSQIPAERWQKPLHFLDTHQTYNIWINPPSEVNRLQDTDYTHLAKLVAGGSNLVCITESNHYGSNQLLKTFRIYKGVERINLLEKQEVDPEKVEVLSPVAWFGYVDKVSFAKVQHKNDPKLGFEIPQTEFYFFRSDTFGIIPYLRIKGTQNAQLAIMHYGKGRIFLCSIPDALTNKGIQKKNNALFWLNLAKNLYHSNRQPILFDEYSHGFGNEILDFNQTWSPFLLPESKYVLWGLTVLFILYAYSQGKRLIKPVKVYEEPRRRVIEFVQAVAHLYEKNKAHTAILNDVASRFSKNLIGHLRINQNSSNAEILQAYEKKYGSERVDQLSALLKKIDSYRYKANLHQTGELIQAIKKFCSEHKIDYYKI
ncbi:MAG: DUF4350 domain-containing protein [Bacteroidia bacterium]|nr:DUF4350 domain-containing protein [Bacteroidia bacterium]